MMKISIIIPVYNAAQSLDRCICSVLEQSYASFEAVLVDDGSTDDSTAICDRYAAEDSRVVVIHKTNGGVSSARNAGIEAATGDYIMFLDADDVLSLDALETLSNKDADMVVGGFRKVVSGHTSYERVPKYDRLYKGAEQLPAFFDDIIGKKDCYMLNSSCFKLYRRRIIMDNGLRFNEALKYGEDKIFVFSYLSLIGTVRTVDSVVYDYVQVEDSLSSDLKSDDHLRQVLILLKEYIPLLENLRSRYASSERLNALYHVDVVSRYIFRILTSFALRKSELLTSGNIAQLYSYMKEDGELGIFSVRLMQVPNVLLYRIGNPEFTRSCYAFTSSICRYISRK
jgi:glycosyltransferase involved in cell wall biosynthesis